MEKIARCKFRCDELTKRTGRWCGADFIHSAKFSVVTDGSEEDKKFFAATPSGTLEIGLIVPDVFEVGKTYYIDVTPADV